MGKADDSGQIITIDSGEYVESAEIAKSLAQRKSQAKRIYLDHNATTYLDPEVRAVISEYMKKYFGNPSSIYREGKDARAMLNAARRSLAQLLNCTAKRIVFTGGGSEANNLAIKGVAFANWNGKNNIITSTIEHPSVLEVCRWLEEFGVHITYLGDDHSGRVKPSDLKASITPETSLVSIMMANNETGSIQPIAELAAIAKENGVLFHTDAIQAIGKIPVDVEALNIDLLTISGHKIYGPKGVGALLIRKGVELHPLIHGGKRESGRRAGTENLINIIGSGKTAEPATQHLTGMEKVRMLRNRLESGIKRLVPEAKLNGHKTERLPNTVNITLPGIRGESLVLAPDQRGVSISSGSACRSGSPEPSHALPAMSLSEKDAHCAIRISPGLRNTEDEIDLTPSLLEEIIKDNKTGVRFTPCCQFI